ncbi:hypothetical protein K5549_009705 [Capra hircus]|nr:hypothetical protein K5549_009705 [Capra hircus]
MNSFSNEFDCHFLDEVSSDDDKHAFYIADLGDILKKHLRWFKALPRSPPFLQSNAMTLPIGQDLTVPARLNYNWCCLRMSPERITYANLYKQVSQIKHTASNRVQMMTFDSEVELMKVSRAHPKVKLVLQIATDNSKTVCHLSVKFELDIDVICVIFHVGSGCTDPETFVQVISDACCVFDIGAKVGFNMYLLAIGGGFPGSEDITSVIKPALDKYFPSDSGVRIISEPGRYYVEQTDSDDKEESSEQTVMYYMSDGVYGITHMKPLLQKRPKPDKKCYSSSIWGPICDGLDHIVEHYNLHVGNWMLFENMGAYTVTAASTVNGFQRPTIYYVMPGPTWQLMKQIQNQDFPPRVEEQEVSPLHPVLCPREQHEAAFTCASSSPAFLMMYSAIN